MLGARRTSISCLLEAESISKSPLVLSTDSTALRSRAAGEARVFREAAILVDLLESRLIRIIRKPFVNSVKF
jgi:hypothetical protein